MYEILREEIILLRLFCIKKKKTRTNMIIEIVCDFQKVTFNNYLAIQLCDLLFLFIMDTVQIIVSK